MKTRLKEMHEDWKISECNGPSRTPRTSIRQRGAAPSVSAGVARTALGRCERTAWSHVHDVLQHSVGPASPCVQRQLLAIQGDGLHAATQPVGDRQAASVARGGVLAYVTAKVNAVVKIEGPQSARGCARGRMHPVQHEFSIITVHLQGNRVPLAIANLSAVDRHQPGAAAAVKLVLQTAVHDLFQGQKIQL